MAFGQLFQSKARKGKEEGPSPEPQREEAKATLAQAPDKTAAAPSPDPAPGAGEKSGTLADDILSLFATEEPTSDPIYGLAQGMEEVDMHHLAQECRELLQQLRAQRR